MRVVPTIAAFDALRVLSHSNCRGQPETFEMPDLDPDLPILDQDLPSLHEAPAHVEQDLLHGSPSDQYRQPSVVTPESSGLRRGEAHHLVPFRDCYLACAGLQTARL